MKTMAALTAVSLLAFVAARAADRPEAPRLQLVRLDGSLNASAQARPPLIASGAEIRVTSGTAVFESDSHVEIRAEEGDAFVFRSFPPSDERGAGLSLTVPADALSALNVDVGGIKLLVSPGGAVDVSSQRAGREDVVIASRRVDLVPGSALASGEGLTFKSAARSGPGLDEGIGFSVFVPYGQYFQNSPPDTAAIDVMSTDEGGWTWTAEGLASVSSGIETAIASWPDVSQKLARTMAEKYGEPSQASPDFLIWNDNGPWKKTVVYRYGDRFLRQSIRFDVPQARATKLSEMEMGLTFDPSSQELSAASQSEDTNVLALNLAHDVLDGKMTATQARAAYARAVSLSSAGKSVPEMRVLLF
ncbi:MAG: hypothetical protein HYZ74_07150 [Elusimicrobia bacterium]|nr:hypothetical protein [Elusimicrobiota bacterium]